MGFLFMHSKSHYKSSVNMNGKQPTLIDQRLYKTVNGRIKETALQRYITETVLHTFVLI